MMPKSFKDLMGCVRNTKVVPHEKRLAWLKRQIQYATDSLKRQQLAQKLCKYLANGETMGGFFGCSPTYAMFVRQYTGELVGVAGRSRVDLLEADMVIVPEMLVEHVLRVDIPDPADPNRSTNTPAKVDVPGIVERMLKHTRHAKNVSIGTFADVLCEACSMCGKQVPVAAFDEYLDDDNGREFTIKRICGACSQVDLIAYYPGKFTTRDPQYCLTDDIYRK